MRPPRKAQALGGNRPLPGNPLFHIDPRNQWSALSPALLAPLADQSITGRGGRMADALQAMSSGNNFPPVVSAAGNNIFCAPRLASARTVDTGGSSALASSLRRMRKACPAAERDVLSSALRLLAASPTCDAPDHADHPTTPDRSFMRGHCISSDQV